MSDVFISYARSTSAQAQQVAEGLRALGYGVWRDDEIPAHRAYSDVIDERLRSAKAVVVVWSSDAARSQWVQSEADRARADEKLVQLTIDGAPLPMPFDRIQCADLAGWTGDFEAPGWRKVAASVADLTGGAGASKAMESTAPRKLSICVLPFANMSGEAEQEYFSDGISEDIITDLSKVGALFVVARNSAFQFKGKHVDLRQIARQLEVSHIMEGSVRKAGSRVRITAQLIDGATGGHTWAERWDRDLTDIFALQDEISQAIVAALKLRLLPEEKQAIERRGTANPDAYELYLMARRDYISGNRGDRRGLETTLRLCRRATEIDPAYARAWALLAAVQTILWFHHGATEEEDGRANADRALALDPALAEAHAVQARHLSEQGRPDEALARIEAALRLDPESYEVNEIAGLISFRQQRLEDAIRHYEKATALSEGDFGAPGMLLTGYTAVGDRQAAMRAAKTTLDRAEKALAQDQSNGTAMGFGVNALALLGEAERARDWIRRALLIDPDNLNMRYNFACAMSAQLRDTEAALDLLDPFFARTTGGFLEHSRIDPDLDDLRDDPRFQAMFANAEARVAAGEAGPAPPDA